MVDINRAFSINELSFNDDLGIFHGTDDPTSVFQGNIQAAPVGSIYIRFDNTSPFDPSTSQIYQRFGSGDYDWRRISLTIGDDVPVVQARDSVGIPNTPTGIPLTWTDRAFDITDQESDDSVIEHDDIIRDRIYVKETGWYEMNYILRGDDEMQARIRVNDATIIPGSTQQSGDPLDVNDIITSNNTKVFYYLDSGDYLTIQIQAATSNEGLSPDGLFLVKRLRGSKGEKGDAGSGSDITVQSSGSPVPNTPHDTLNFTGLLSASDAGGGVANISTIFGANFQRWEQDTLLSDDDGTAWINRLDVTTTSLPIGTYRIGWSYGWNHNDNGNDFEGRIVLDGGGQGTPVTSKTNDDPDDFLMYHKQEPQDSAGTGSGKWAGTGTNQVFRSQGFKYVTFASESTHTLRFDMSTSSNGVDSSVWDLVIELWRVS